MRYIRLGVAWLMGAVALLAACSDSDSTSEHQPVNQGQGATAGSSSNAGSGGSGGQNTGASGGQGGNGGDSGSSGNAGVAGSSGISGSGGNSGSGGTAGTSGSAGSGGNSGSAGSAGNAGTSGAAGNGGTSGNAGTAGSAGWWAVSPGVRWQWELSTYPPDLSYDDQVDVYDIDLFEAESSFIADAHSRGKRVICYVSVGSWEDWRPDADQFSAEILGNDYDGWPGEKWVDIRNLDVLGPILQARFDLCRDKGFDGLEPDNIDSYGADTGFSLTYQDQVNFNLWLANEAHIRGLSIGLKNDSDQISDLLDAFDWALTEDCFDQGWCADMQPFVQQGKAVLMCEYTDTGVTKDQFCPQAESLGFSPILKNRELDGWRDTCPLSYRIYRKKRGAPALLC